MPTPVGFEALTDAGGDTLTVDSGDALYVVAEALEAGEAYTIALGPIPLRAAPGDTLTITAIASDIIGTPVEGVFVSLEFVGMTVVQPDSDTSDEMGRVSFTFSLPDEPGVLMIRAVTGGELYWGDEDIDWGDEDLWFWGVSSAFWMLTVAHDIGDGLVAACGSRKRKRAEICEKPSYLDIGPIETTPRFRPRAPQWQPQQQSQPRAGMAQLGQTLGQLAMEQEAKLQAEMQKYAA